MEPQQEQIAPEIIQALIAKASESVLSINDYLARLLGLENGHMKQASFEMTPELDFGHSRRITHGIS